MQSAVNWTFMFIQREFICDLHFKNLICFYHTLVLATVCRTIASGRAGVGGDVTAAPPDQLSKRNWSILWFEEFHHSRLYIRSISLYQWHSVVCHFHGQENSLSTPHQSVLFLVKDPSLLFIWRRVIKSYSVKITPWHGPQFFERHQATIQLRHLCVWLFDPWVTWLFGTTVRLTHQSHKALDSHNNIAYDLKRAIVKS